VPVTQNNLEKTMSKRLKR